MQNLVIVESPTKARTLSRFLGKNYRIEASMGHIRDLPKSEMGIDIDHNFEPKYIVPRDKRKKVNELKKLADDASVIWLASDPDREGEAIAWHLEQLLVGERGKGKGEKKEDVNSKPIHRVEFHEITEGAIKEAFEHPREINMDLVDAQQGRRVLDRLVGYSLSPLLWKKVKRGLSAGRVQTVALRLIVEREKEISAFNPVEYWTIEVQLSTEGSQFKSLVIEKNGEKLEIHNKTEADKIVTDLENSKYSIAKITKKEVRRQPAAPFTTSTLQQTSGNRLHFSAKKTMTLAQNLYEHGLITYMRTDSVNLATTAVDAIREHVTKSFGNDYLPQSPRLFKAKSKNVQEAHEAIRPTNISLSAEAINVDSFGRDHKRLYDLIWKRAVSSQMSEAVVDQTSVDILAKAESEEYTLRATGSILKFDGWLKLYQVTKVKDSDDRDETDEEETDGKNDILPELREGQSLEKQEVSPLQHFTEPPPRYTEASLIKKLEELGIGRPSTYAPTLSTIQDRYYVERVERKFIPTSLGSMVTEFLIKYFPDVFDYTFTAQMEDNLDEVAEGKSDWRTSLGEFYKPFEQKIEKTQEEAVHVDLPVEKVDKKCPLCGKDLVVRTGKFGKFLACSGFPDCKHTEAFEEIIDAKCPLDGGEVLVRKTKKGKIFYGCKNYPNCTWASWNKPKSENLDDTKEDLVFSANKPKVEGIEGRGTEDSKESHESKDKIEEKSQ